MNEFYYPTKIGVLKIRFEKDTLHYCKWCFNFNSSINITKFSNADISFYEHITNFLDAYFNGLQPTHDFKIISKGSRFQMNVWSEISKIPYGETITYKELARRSGNPKAYRAVANACGANPVGLFIPCHRVVGSKGNIGGYTGGIEKKIFLLNLENNILKEV